MSIKFKFDSSYLVMLGPTLSCIGSFISAYYFRAALSLQRAVAISSCSTSLGFLSTYLPLCVLWSQLSKSFVDGFETTGAACLMGFYNLGLYANYWFVDFFLDFYDVKLGYLERLDKVDVSFIYAQILLAGLSFLFFCFKEPVSGMNRTSRL